MRGAAGGGYDDGRRVVEDPDDSAAGPFGAGRYRPFICLGGRTTPRCANWLSSLVSPHFWAISRDVEVVSLFMSVNGEILQQLYFIFI